MTGRSLWLDRGTGADPKKIVDNSITCIYEPMLWAGELGDWWTGTAFIAGRLP